MAEKKQTRRSTGKLVVLNEEELIRQVVMRPILYDRSLKSYRKSGLRLQYWKEVGNAMGATVEECRRRWRSLRDAFSKHYKQNNRLACGKRKKWVFYDQMSFIAPYLDNASCEIDEHLLDDFSEDADGMLLLTDGSQHAVSQVESTQKDAESPIDTSDYLKVSTTEGTDATDGTDGTAHDKDDDTQTGYSTTHNTYTELDGDEKFLLSCAPVLRRLSARKNALARLKIQQILFDIEFGADTH